jgi:hypothetical protein
MLSGGQTVVNELIVSVGDSWLVLAVCTFVCVKVSAAYRVLEENKMLGKNLCIF